MCGLCKHPARRRRICLSVCLLPGIDYRPGNATWRRRKKQLEGKLCERGERMHAGGRGRTHLITLSPGSDTISKLHGLKWTDKTFCKYVNDCGPHARSVPRVWRTRRRDSLGPILTRCMRPGPFDFSVSIHPTIDASRFREMADKITKLGLNNFSSSLSAVLSSIAMIPFPKHSDVRFT